MMKSKNEDEHLSFITFIFSFQETMQVLNNQDTNTSQQPPNNPHVVAVPLPEKEEEEFLSILNHNETNNYNTIPIASAPPLPSSKTNKLEAEWKPFLNSPKAEKTHWGGVFLAFLSGTFFTLCSATVKAVRSMDPMELLVIRSVMQVAIMLPIALCKGESLIGPKGLRLMLVLQGVVGGLTLVLLFYSFRLLPLGDATTIIFSSPVVVMIMSFIFLREPCGLYRTMIVCLLLTGVVLISKPPFLFHIAENQSYNILGYVAAILGTIFMASNIVVMRKCKDIHFSVVVLHLSIWSLVVAAALVIWKQHFGLPRSPIEWGLVVLVGVFGLSGQVLVAKALGLEGAGRVAVTRSLDIVLAFLLQVFVFGEIPDHLSITGAVLVIICVIGMGVEEQIINFVKLIP